VRFSSRHWRQNRSIGTHADTGNDLREIKDATTTVLAFHEIVSCVSCPDWLTLVGIQSGNPVKMDTPQAMKVALQRTLDFTRLRLSTRSLSRIADQPAERTPKVPERICSGSFASADLHEGVRPVLAIYRTQTILKSIQ
jgi:hypothetical protein